MAFSKCELYLLEMQTQGAWLVQLVEHVTLDVGVVGLSPVLGIEIT